MRVTLEPSGMTSSTPELVEALLRKFREPSITVAAAPDRGDGPPMSMNSADAQPEVPW